MANEKRLIDEFMNEIKNEFIELCCGNDFEELTLLEIGETIDRIYEKYIAIPTVDAAPVVHGRWEHNEYGLQCSKCACDSLYNGFNHPVRSAFCPNCGAVMEDKYHEAID
jgi:hypothetical protein